MMTLYHGSHVEVTAPDVSFSRDNLDFGKGFYVTPIFEQACSWAERFKRRKGTAVVSKYELASVALSGDTQMLIFDGYTEAWLDFIIACRSGKPSGDYEVIVGGIANDKVFDTVQLYLDGLVDKEQAIKRLRYDKPNMQYCLRDQSLIDKYLTFASSEVI